MTSTSQKSFKIAPLTTALALVPSLVLKISHDDWRIARGLHSSPNDVAKKLKLSLILVGLRD